MERKTTIKNPGCQFCRYYLHPFPWKNGRSREACRYGGRRAIAQAKSWWEAKKWKWADCLDPKIKNEQRICPHFEIPVSFAFLREAMFRFIRRLGEQYPPTFEGEK